jgi:hypothetical protein
MTADNMIEPKRNHANNTNLIEGLTSDDMDELVNNGEGLRYIKSNKKKKSNESVIEGIPA